MHLSNALDEHLGKRNKKVTNGFIGLINMRYAIRVHASIQSEEQEKLT